jgi:tyrosyl-tRNA synthetase
VLSFGSSDDPPVTHHEDPTVTTAEAADVMTQQDSISIARAAGVNPLDYMRARGFVQDVTDEDGLRAAFAAGPVTFYQGFDPTATSLHAGGLLGIMMLSTLQRFGHRPIALGGGGTAMVGDPTGKTSTREVLTLDQINANLAGILPQFAKLVDFEGGRFLQDPPNPAALMVNNADWLLDIRWIPFLRDIGRHFSVNEMLAAETYRNRLEHGLNFVEFNYRLVQSYDFLHLFRTEGCLLQLGGSDQWGNIVGGVDLVRRADGAKVFGMVCPLLTTATGEKMGKTAGNSVWLDADLLSPFDFFQYWVNCDDRDVEKLLRFYTFLPDERIAELVNVQDPAALREAKRVLATEVTALVHSRAAADAAGEAARSLFSGARSAASMIDDPNLPTVTIPAGEVDGTLSVADAFVRAGLASSRGDARRTAQQGGLSIDDQKVENVDHPLDEVLTGRTVVLLRSGKKRFMRLVIE